MIIREKVELIEKVPDVYAAKRIHLRERQHAGEPIEFECFDQSNNEFTYTSSSAAWSGENQLTFTTFSYSSKELMAIGM